MLDLHGLNYWALLVAWVINLGVGAWWYSPAGFGKMWSKLSGVDMMKMPKNEANTAIVFVAVAAAVQTLTLGIVLNSLGTTTATSGLMAGLLVWLGFTAATTVGTVLYSRKSWAFWWLNAGFFLIVMAVNSVMLTVWH